MTITYRHPRKGRSCTLLFEGFIPLSCVKYLTSGAVKKLARLGIHTVEDLYVTEKSLVEYHISSRPLRKEILALCHALKEKVRIKKLSLRFHELTSSRNIRLTAVQRSRLIAVEVFSHLLKNIEEVIAIALEIDALCTYRQRKMLEKIKTLSLRAIAA